MDIQNGQHIDVTQVMIDKVMEHSKAFAAKYVPAEWR